MQLTICAVGKLGRVHEQPLVEHYLARSRAMTQGLGFRSVSIIEIPESRLQTANQRKQAEAENILGRLPADAVLMACDETGRHMSSKKFAQTLAQMRDDNIPALAFAIGGADGHGDKLCEKAVQKIAFGAMTWPHGLARILLAEQIYRAMTILKGHPYHRE